MKIFITGASGFLGKHLLSRFTSQHECLALVRSRDAAQSVQNLGATAVSGDLDNVTADMMRGCDVVIHTAALAKPYGKRADFIRINVEGTQHVLESARKAGVKRFIHISTEAVCFKGHDLIDIDESAPTLCYPKYGYAFSKAVAEKAVLQANQSDVFETLAIRPSWIWGPGDTNALPMMVDMVKTGKFMWVDNGKARKTTTHVENLVDAIECALTKGKGGEAYFVNDSEYRSLKDFLTPMLATQGLTIPDKSVPGWLIRIVGSLAESWWNVTGQRGKPAGTRLEADFMSSEIVIRCDKAKSDLGWLPRITVTQGLEKLTNESL